MSTDDEIGDNALALTTRIPVSTPGTSCLKRGFSIDIINPNRTILKKLV